MNKLVVGTIAVLALTAVLAGCGGDKPSDPTTGGATNAPVATASPSPTVEKQQKDITVYYTDVELTNVIGQQVSVEYDTDTDILEAAIADLQQDGQDEAVSLWKNIQFNKVAIEAGAVTLDVHMPDEARLGAPGEELAIESLLKTLFELGFVESVDLLVDGEAVESLMGHVELEHPFMRTEQEGN